LRPFVLSLLFAAAASAQPFVFSPETAVAPPRVGTAATSMQSMKMASDGTNQLVVWRDDRSSMPARVGTYSGSGLFAARVDAHGKVLDIPNIALPSIGIAWPIWNGREFVVVGGGEYVRISAAGELLDRTPRSFPLMPRGEVLDVAWSGDRLLIAGRTYRYTTPTYNLYVTMYDADFNVVAGEFLLESSANYVAYAPKIATNGRSFLIGSSSCNGPCTFNVSALDRDGSIIRQGAIAPALGSWGYVRVASDGDGYFFLYDTQPLNGKWELAALLLSPEMVLRGNVGPFGPGNQTTTRLMTLAWEGDSYQLIYLHVTYDGVYETTLRSVSIDAQGNSADGRGTILESLNFKPIPSEVSILGRPGARFALMNVRPASGAPEGWTGRAYSDATAWPASPVLELGQGALQEETPAVATAGDVSLMTWREADRGSDPFVLYAARVDSFGRTLDAAPLRLASTTCDGRAPAVAANGHDFLVVWQDRLGVNAMRVGRDGRPLDAAPLRLSSTLLQDCAGTRPAIAWNGSNYLVVWRGAPSVTVPAGVNAVRITPGGTLLDTVAIDLTRGDKFTDVNVASDGKDWFVAWGTPANIAQGARVSAAGTLPDGQGFALYVPRPSILYWSGTNYVILSADLAGLRAVRATNDGQRLDLMPPQQAPVMKVPVDPTLPQSNCDARGCFVYGVRDGVLVATRMEETPSGMKAAGSTPLVRINDDWQSLVLFGPEKTQLGYLRLRYEAPYAGSWHLFTRSMLPARGRAVR